MQQGKDARLTDLFDDDRAHDAKPDDVTDAIDRGARVDTFMPHHSSLLGGWGRFCVTPLMVAARDGNLACVKVLVEHGANINAYDSKSETPIGYAAEGGSTMCVKYFISRHAILNAKRSNHHHTSPLNEAGYGHPDICEMLKAAGETE